MGIKYWMIGNSYEAEGPVDFWRKWNTQMHIGLNKVYNKLGGINRPIIASYTPFVISGIWHDIAFRGTEWVTGGEWYPSYFWCVSFGVFGVPVAFDKWRIKSQAKKVLGEELDTIVEEHGEEESKRVLRKFSQNLSEDRVEELSDYFSDYDSNRNSLVDELFQDTHRGVLTVMRRRREKRRNSVIPRPMKTALTWTYVLGTLELFKHIL